MQKLHKILIYTNNSVGHGHTNRILALALGLKKINQNNELLIVAGTDIPQVFLQNGIEIIKLPSTKIEFDSKSQTLVPRYLKMGLPRLMKLRQEIIKSAYDCFEPDILIVEHNMVGQAWELAPILIEKWRNKDKFKLVYITRGIIDSPKELRVNYSRQQHHLESIDIPSLYDHVFVLDDKDIVDYCKEYGFEKNFCSKIKYLGLITTKNKADLNPEITKKQLNLNGTKLIVISLGRVGNIYKIINFTVKAFTRLSKGYLLKIQIDPYLDQNIVKKIHELCRNNENIIVTNFSPNLIDEINISELVISRAGYNTVAEILLTNAKAILFPEVGRTEEELYRCKKISKKGNIEYFDERKVKYREFEQCFKKILVAKKADYNAKFDNAMIAKQILNSLEGK